MTARDVGLAAAANHPWVAVHRRPRIAILATGDEIALPGEPIPPGGIVSSNSHALAALVRAAGGNSKTDDGTTTSDTGAPTDTGATGTTDTGTTGGTGGSGGTTGGTDTGGSTPSDGETKTVVYRYVADVTFIGANGKKRKIKGLERLEILPNESDPLLIFLGASKNGGNAVFLVDSTLTAEGEGKCKPSKDQCGFLYLGPGSEEEFVDQDGNSYTLRVDAIRKEQVTPKRIEKVPASKSSSDKQTANAAVGDDTAVRRFVPQLFGDLVTESTTQTNSSDGDQTGR